MEERYLLALYKGDQNYLQEVAEELLTALAAESMYPQEPSEEDTKLPF